MKVELNDIIATLKTQFTVLEKEYVDECAIDFMSRRATYLDGQCAMLHSVIEQLEDKNFDEFAEEVVDSVFEKEEELTDEDWEELMEEMAQDIDEFGYNPYLGCYDMDL